MIRTIRLALASSAILTSLAVGVPALAAPDAAPAAQGQHDRDGDHHGRHHRGQARLAERALGLASLTNAQRAQVEALAQEEKSSHATVHVARAKVMTALAGQVDRGAIDRAALAPTLKEETDAVVAARLREHTIAERLHVVLTAKQCEEVGGGKDFLHPARAEADVRARAERHLDKRVDHLAKKLPTASPEERTAIAARLRQHAAR